MLTETRRWSGRGCISTGGVGTRSGPAGGDWQQIDALRVSTVAEMVIVAGVGLSWLMDGSHAFPIVPPLAHDTERPVAPTGSSEIFQPIDGSLQ